MSGEQPYDDSFSLGPVPGGDILFEPPGQVGSEQTSVPSAPTVPTVPPEYRQPTYAPPPPPPVLSPRPSSWGPSRVNIPSSAGPPPSPAPAQRPTRWQPAPGSRRKVPGFVLVLGALWVAGQVLGGLGGLADRVFGNDTGAGSQTDSSSEQVSVDGMSQEGGVVLTSTTEIAWTIDAPAGQVRTYDVYHDGELVQTLTHDGYLRLSQPFEQGRWWVAYDGSTAGECSVYVDQTRVAVLERSGYPCLLDTSWLPPAS